MSTDLRSVYRTILDDPFPRTLEITLGTQRLSLRKRTWKTAEEGKAVEHGLRYGDNPGQPAALYELAESTLDVHGAALIRPGLGLASSIAEEQILSFGKHPGKTNLTDLDSAVLILRYLADAPACAIMKHNNPCGVARADDVLTAVRNAYWGDPLAAFGGCVAVNRPLTREAAEFLAEVFIEVIACPDYEEGALAALERKQNLRIFKLPRLGALEALADLRCLQLTSLIDGGLIVQLSLANPIKGPRDFLPAVCESKGVTHKAAREPTPREYRDLVFAWAVEQGVISNSVLFAKNDATVSVGAGGQDRVGVVKQAIAKAFDRERDRLALARRKKLFFELELAAARGEMPRAEVEAIIAEAGERGGGLRGSVLASDAFFPRRDGVDLAIAAGVSAICHPGGSVRDWESIQAVNEADPQVAMVFTGQRAFRH